MYSVAATFQKANETMTAPNPQQLQQHARNRERNDYAPVDAPEDKTSLGNSGFGNIDENTIGNRDGLMSIIGPRNFELEQGIDFGVVDELVGDIHELRKGLLVLLLLFVAVGAFIAVDDHYAYKKLEDNYGTGQISLVEDTSKPPHPHMGHKLQINASAFTVNDFECLQIDTGNWPSERVHCELRPSAGDIDDDVARYDFVVEHFDDEYCQNPNAENPTVRHTASGCFYFEGYNHSYNDLCHKNRTLTVSAFYGPGCLTPMPVTAVNLLPEDGR